VIVSEPQVALRVHLPKLALARESAGSGRLAGRGELHRHGQLEPGADHVLLDDSVKAARISRCISLGCRRMSAEVGWVIAWPILRRSAVAGNDADLHPIFVPSCGDTLVATLG
jgi:hypothetical protein